MKKILFFTATIVSIVFFTGCKVNEKDSSEEIVNLVNGKRPNIVFIVTDDQRWDALGFAGNDIISTPNMDKLAREGIFFNNAFVTTPVCAASRASLFTGLYERTHDYTFGKPNLDDEYMYESYPYLLRKAGYRTGMIGKFGVKVNEGIIDSMFDWKKLTFWPYLKDIDGKQVHLADINGNHAIDFIKSSKDQPFCLSLSFWSPHADDGADEQYFWPEYCDELYANTEIPVTETANPEFFEALPEFLRTTMNRKRWYWRYDTPEKHQRMVKGYYRMISCVDSVISRIRLTLEQEGLADNTVIILMGDNGYFTGERGYAGKWLMYEQSIRVPLIIYDPRLPEKNRNKTYREMVLNVDVTPTILDLAGVDIPERYQGKTLTEFYGNQPQDWRNAIFCEHRLENNELLPKTECYRDSVWKFIRYEDAPELIELYNLNEDTNETNNLAYDQNYAVKVEYYKHKCDSIAGRLLSERIQKE
ncbi:MAG TPA: sulfatase [Bacteroidales bacterium]|nr:sulfatase [Bacteroidales bacterium]